MADLKAARAEEEMKARYGCGESELTHYTCHRTSHKIAIDGRLDRPAWREAPKSHRFVDLVTGVPGSSGHAHGLALGR